MTTLTERYLAAATRGIPGSKRPDVERELRSSIADAVDDRVAAGEDPTAAEVAVLEGLGDPSSLAAGIAGRPQHLIGPGLFDHYRRTLVMLLSIVPAIVGVVLGALELTRGGMFGDVLAAGIGGALTVAFHVAFWVTVVFVLLERVDPEQLGDAVPSKAIGPWTVDRLPPLPTPGRVGIGDAAGEILGLVIGIAGLVALRGITWVQPGTGETVSLLTPSASSWLPILAAILVALIAFQLVLLRVGRWTTSLALVHAALQTGFAVPVIVLALTGSIISPAFADAIGWPPLADGRGGVMVTIAVGVLLVTAWEVIDGFRRARRVTAPPIAATVRG